MSLRRGKTVTAGFLAEFQQFILRGNVVDLAVAVVVGGAFGKIVESLIADLVTPLILQPALSAAKVEDLAKLSIGGILYGKFLAAVLNFLVISLVIFVLIKLIAALKKQEEEAVAAEAPPVDHQARLVEVLEKLEAKI
ncbi:MAG: large conductance mechanosensitive channel protein MscL [Pseudanabaenaceae cyanobacterium bins.68]|nr:large conductance mechanosensitive channel protein MscL [Pseudanabaenaceae cyanobacterium bins.68]